MFNTIFYRSITTTRVLQLPNPNDQEDLEKEINKFELECENTDRTMDEVEQEVHEIEDQLADLMDEEGSTELSKILSDRSEIKDKLIGAYEEKISEALDSDDNRNAKSLVLEKLEKSTQMDLETLEHIESQWPDAAESDEDLGEAQEKIYELKKDLEAQKAQVSDLQHKWHENDLPPIKGTNEEEEDNNASKNKDSYQDSSDVYQTDFNSFDPFDDG